MLRKNIISTSGLVSIYVFVTLLTKNFRIDNNKNNAKWFVTFQPISAASNITLHTIVQLMRIQQPRATSPSQIQKVPY